MHMRFQVDGFRSLIAFDAELKPGLNVLVGPNGTGKSNFISFLDFINALFQQGLNAAVGRLQGAGNVFSRERFSDRSASLTFRVRGSVTPSEFRDYVYPTPADDGRTYSYDYACQIDYSRSGPAVFIAAETITFEADHKRILSIERSTSREAGEFRSNVNVWPDNRDTIDTLFRWALYDLAKNASYQSALKAVMEAIRPELSILSYMSSSAFGIAVVQQLRSYSSVNIDPAAARKVTQVGAITSIRSNGEGLSGALYQLERGEYSAQFEHPLGRDYVTSNVQPSVFQAVLAWSKEVNPTVSNIYSDLNFHNGVITPMMSMTIGEQEESFSFDRISDGTVKWLTLVTMLFLEQRLSVIEEPENFLHPFMQETFVELCRAVLSEKPRRSIVISTHSPTLLDCCTPEEITLFELARGTSKASRVANARELAEKIKHSRFGLGYYYRMGALYGAHSGPS